MALRRELTRRHERKARPARARYKVRQQTVEPVFGIIKAVLGFRRFLLRGAKQVSPEWSLVSLASNAKRLHLMGTRLQLA